VFARKLIREASEEDISNEVRAITKLCNAAHPNIVEVYFHGCIMNTCLYGYFIDMEYCAVNLQTHMQHMPTPPLPYLAANQKEDPVYWEGVAEVTSILAAIACGLAFIHEHGEVHRDLKPANGIS
jgi:serine/threonine protein kinase